MRERRLLEWPRDDKDSCESDAHGRSPVDTDQLQQFRADPEIPGYAADS